MGGMFAFMGSQYRLGLRKHRKCPKFIELGERLEKMKERYEQGLLHSLDFLKELLTLAREVVEAEKQVDPEDEQDKAKVALTELFNQLMGDVISYFLLHNG